jgi:glyoxylase-like metal-dependent hydrolase (beta-lactamase superfamily II)/rhodanese-related sulfurtransferase
MISMWCTTEREEPVMVDGLVLPVVDDGLGNSSYLVDLGGRRALAVDPSRDLRALDAVAARHGLRVVAAADTHLHADFLSGATRLAARDGAVVYASAAGGRRFPHTGLGDGDEVDLGGLTLRAWSTPGHTGEHVAYLLADGDTVLGVFTGGSLLVGAAARTDLVAPERTEPLARAQYASLRRLATLPDTTAVWPTHGAGSFCSAPPGAERTTTIGRERATNPLFAAENEDDFVRQLLGGLGSFPPYFLRLAEANRRGPSLPPGNGGLPSLTPRQVTDIPSAEVIDVRPPAAYAGGHIRGSLAIPLRAQFATWLGWLVPDPGTPLVFVRDPNQDPDEIVWQARKIGYDNLVGELAGGVAAWSAAGHPVAALPLLDPTQVTSGQVDPARILDIRQDREYADGHLPAARHVELGALPAAALPPGPVVTMCGHGERATTAASLLERAGHEDVAVAAGGPDDWAQASGTSLETLT